MKTHNTYAKCIYGDNIQWHCDVIFKGNYTILKSYITYVVSLMLLYKMFSIYDAELNGITISYSQVARIALRNPTK